MDEASKELQLPNLVSTRSKYCFGKMDYLRQKNPLCFENLFGIKEERNCHLRKMHDKILCVKL